MKCVICKEGEYRAGLVTVVLTRDESTVVIKKVPGHVCAQCGEYE
ncbi:MAG: type II toxin-antitoxin system MqsA family antitoxin, partial [Treponema sp.]|nr:type II toxin-antitoxin system MqsA family antitoxin [Treponema sp.]